MSVTVLNDTNFFINMSLSAGVNYDWRNVVPPKQYAVMYKGAVDTLNVRWYDGEASLYGISAVQIGLFVAGTLVGVLATVGGVVAIVFSAGTAAAGLAVAVGAGASYLSAGGLAIGGIALAADDFKRTPANWTNIQLIQNRIFKVKGEQVAAKTESGQLKLIATKPLEIVEVSRDDFSRLIEKEGWVEFREDQDETASVEDTYYSGTKKAVDGPSAQFLTAPEIISNDLLGGPVWIYPSFAGVPDVRPGSWTPGGKDGEEVQLWNDRRQAMEWMIVPVPVETKAYNPKAIDPQKENFVVQAYNIYNPDTDMYACVSKEAADTNIRVRKHPEPGSPAAKQHYNTDRYSQFFLIRSLNCWAFVPITRQTRELSNAIHLPAVINQDGNTGNGTQVRVGDRTGPHPGRARWVVERRSLEATPPLMQRQIEALSDGSPLGNKLIDQPVRIFPAIARRHLLPMGELPVCWEIEGDSMNEGASIQLQRRDDPKAQWVIRKREYTGIDAFSFYCPALQRYAAISRDGYLRATKDPLLIGYFSIKYSMGFLSFFSLDDLVRGDVWVDGFENGVKLRVGGLPPMEPSRNRWQVISTTSMVATEMEKWKSQTA